MTTHLSLYDTRQKEPLKTNQIGTTAMMERQSILVLKE